MLRPDLLQLATSDAIAFGVRTGRQWGKSACLHRQPSLELLKPHCQNELPVAVDLLVHEGGMVCVQCRERRA